MKMSLVLLLLLVTSMGSAAAGESTTGDVPVSAGHRSTAPEFARVEIVNIEDGAIVPTTFLVQFSVSGMGIAPAGSNIENTGHHHLLVDVDELPDPNLPLPKNEQFIHFGGGQTETELTLPEGEHTLQLEFADYSHVPFDPVVVSERITIRVSADANGMLAE